MKQKGKPLIPSGVWCITSVVVLFGYLGIVMGVPNMLNTIMKTAHDLLLNTVFYLMSICVITGAIGKVFVEFGVVALLERTLRPLMRPIFNLPGVTSLGAVMTFLSDNPAIISLANDKRFASYFKKYQFISLTNFGTAFGMGLLVIVFMASQGYYVAPLIGLLGACFGCVCSTRLMQRFVLKAYPQYATEDAVSKEDIEEEEKEENENTEKTVFIRLLNAVLDGGRSGVEVGMAIIPGVLIISTFVMIFTFGPAADGAYNGAAYQGVELLPWLANKIDFVFEWLFGFHDPHLVAFPIVSSIFGPKAIFYAALLNTPNTFFIFTAGVMLVKGEYSLKSLNPKLLFSPAMIAAFIAAILVACGVHTPDIIARPITIPHSE
jgi:nucleoside recognition membrane protein YjiH